MSNEYFQFMKFRLSQDRCAMKVGTDGVLLGSWCGVSGTQNILDIGTGTGLIAIMTAQRCDARIDAIEIDHESYNQAVENVSQCPWGSRVFVHHLSFQDFAVTTPTRYDLIVSNPPYFSDSLKSAVHGRSIARHTDSLPVDDLLAGASKLLSDNGRFALILPYDAGLHAIDRGADFSLYAARVRPVRAHPRKDFFRILIELTAHKTDPIRENPLSIESDTPGVYSPDYISLTDDFYLFGRN